MEIQEMKTIADHVRNQVKAVNSLEGELDKTFILDEVIKEANSLNIFERLAVYKEGYSLYCWEVMAKYKNVILDVLFGPYTSIRLLVKDKQGFTVVGSLDGAYSAGNALSYKVQAAVLNFYMVNENLFLKKLDKNIRKESERFITRRRKLYEQKVLDTQKKFDKLLKGVE